MGAPLPSSVIEDPTLRDRYPVFEDRDDAGRQLAKVLAPRLDANTLLLGIPSGGVPVAAVIAEQLHLPMDAAVSSKVSFHFNPEAGYGAVAFDGSLVLRHEVIQAAGLTEAQVDADVRRARVRVEQRLERFRGGRPLPSVENRTVCVVDDGLATGLTMIVTVRAVVAMHAGKVVVAVPTGHWEAVQTLAKEADEVVCLNIRRQSPFAVAQAYEHWQDVVESEVSELLQRGQASGGETAA